ncbi:MAG: TolC family protein, partial [Desulfuromonadales bacterium]|nr:TolC family protein [Desulfuromonadales bacterium]
MKLTGSIKILTVMLCCVSLTCVAASAQSAPDALVEEALANNPELEAVRLRAEQFSWKVDQKGSLDDPVLSLSFSNYPNDSLNRDETAMTGDEVRLAQKFPYPGKRDGRAAVAQADSEWSNFQYLDSRHQLAGRVEDVWLRLFYTDRALEVVGRNLALLDDMARLTETRYATGKGMQQDILSTQLEQSRLMQQSLTLQQ